MENYEKSKATMEKVYTDMIQEVHRKKEKLHLKLQEAEQEIEETVWKCKVAMKNAGAAEAGTTIHGPKERFIKESDFSKQEFLT